jgi:delta 1-pyrroline-5-carboxylate dehydrogenase
VRPWVAADASALPEQVCDAVVASFAGAAGQRQGRTLVHFSAQP